MSKTERRNHNSRVEIIKLEGYDIHSATAQASYSGRVLDAKLTINSSGRPVAYLVVLFQDETNTEVTDY